MKTKKGIALVMANAEYIHQNKLPACKKDGQDIRDVFEYLNFDVISGLDLKRSDMYELISRFIDEAKAYSTVLVYYSGHGVQIDGENYFVPVDCEYKTSKSIFKETQLVGINSITEFMTANPNKTNIMILDACRSTVDFSKDIVGTGLTEVMAGNGTLIAFATSPNEVARADATEDGNSYYTKCLLPNIIRPNVKIEDMFKSVRNDVIALTNGEQVPWENTSLNKDFYFNTMTKDEIDIMDVNYTSGRKLNKNLINRLATCEYISEHRNLFITGATGCGKTYMACAFGMEACKRYFTTRYVRLPDLLIDLEIARAEGNYRKVMAKYANPLVLILDEWLLLKPTEVEQKDIFELLHRRRKKSSTIFCSQYGFEEWYDQLGGDDSPLADAIIDRIAHDSYRINITSIDAEHDISMREVYGLDKMLRE